MEWASKLRVKEDVEMDGVCVCIYVYVCVCIGREGMSDRSGNSGYPPSRRYWCYNLAKSM